MTNKEKEILEKDLCARLADGVLVNEDIFNNTVRLTSYDPTALYPFKGIPLNRDTHTYDYYYTTDELKPYLRPISSMTEEEIAEFRELGGLISFKDETRERATVASFTMDAIDYLNKKRISYRTIGGEDMFSLGLAIKVTEENNPYREYGMD